MKSGDRKAQGGIITIVLIILLVLVAIVILWNVVMLTLKNSSSQVSVDQFSFKGEIKYSLPETNDPITVSVHRGGEDANITGIKLVFEFSDGTLKSYEDKTDYPKAFETKEYTISANQLDPSLTNFLNLKKVSLYYTYNESNKEKTTIALDTKEQPSSQIVNPSCTGNSSCDDGNICTTGDVCSNGSCTGTPKCTSPQTCNLNNGNCESPITITDLTDCGTINTAGSYRLINNVVNLSTCFNVTANDVTIDGNGFNITYATGTISASSVSSYGIYINGYNNLMVKNIKIIDGTTAGFSEHALYLINSNSTIIQNNNFLTNSGAGISLSNSNSTTITSNTIKTTAGGMGISVSGSSNSLSSNNVTTNGGTGISLAASSSLNTINSNTIIVVSGAGISLSGSSNNINSNTIIASGAGINLNSVGTNSNTALNSINSNIITTNGASGNGIYLSSSTGGNLTSNIFDSNIIKTSGTTAYGIYLNPAGTASLNSFSSNTLDISNANRIIISGTSTKDNNFTNNIIINRNLSFYDIKFLTPSINGTWLIDQYLENYSFTGVGGTINVKNSQYGVISFINPVNGTGMNLSKDIQIGINSAYVDSSAASGGLNKNASVILSNTGLSSTVTVRANGDHPCSPLCSSAVDLGGGSYSFYITGWTQSPYFLKAVG